MNNNNNYFKENHQNIIFWVVCFILFLPIVILPPNFQPSDWTRVILFKIILTSLIAWLAYRFFYKKDISLSLPKKGLVFYLPLFTLFAYFIFLILSTIFSQDSLFSVFGSPARAGGLLNLLFFFVFVVFIAIFIKGEFWDRLIKINFIAGVLASLLAIVQYFGLFGNIFLGFETGATPSFLGNSTFLAIYTLFLAFSSFTFFLLEEQKKKKLIYGGLFLLFLFTIFVSGSRAAYIGILIGFTFYFLFYPKELIESQNKLIKWITKKRLSIFKIAFVIFMLLILSLVAYVNITPKFPVFIENNEKLSYFIHNRLSFKTVAKDLAGTRLSAWKITTNAIKEKPILGWGPENFHIGFEKYFDPTLPPSLQRLWWDRPHNVFLETAVNYGIIALILYITFWIVLLWQLQKIKRAEKDADYRVENTLRAHGVQATFIGYLIVLFFNFDSFSTYLISFFFIGYAFYLISSKTEKIIIRPFVKSVPFKKIFIVIFLVIISLFFWFWNIKPLYFNEKMVFTKNLSESKQCKKAFQSANNTDWSKSGIIRPYTALDYSDVVRSCTFAEPDKEVEYSKKAISLLKTASQLQTKYSRTWFFMGAFTNVLAAREGNKDNKNKILAEARNHLNKAIELSPKRQEFFLEMEKNYLLAEDYKTMEKMAKDCIKIDSNRGECYWYLGIAQIFMGDQQNGKKNIEFSKKNYGDPSYLQLGIAYISQKNYIEAAKAYEILASIYPKNASYHATLALLHKETGNFERARGEAVRVFELQPENQETVPFIKLLLGLNPNDLRLHSSLASIYKQLGRKEEMKKELLILVSAYSQFVSRNYKSPDNHFALATIYKELEEYEKAYQEALLTIKLDSDYTAKVENFLQSLPPKFLNEYGKWLRKNPDKFFKAYGRYPE